MTDLEIGVAGICMMVVTGEHWTVHWDVLYQNQGVVLNLPWKQPASAVDACAAPNDTSSGDYMSRYAHCVIHFGPV